MTVPSYSVNSEKKSKEPVLVWETTTKANIDWRLVVVYYVSGNAPEIVLEKKEGHDALGGDRWVKVKLPEDLPPELFQDFVVTVTQDEAVLKN